MPWTRPRPPPRIPAVTAIPTGAHPAGLLVSGTTLYVSNAQSDTISVVDTTQGTVTRTISLRPGPFLTDPAQQAAVAPLTGVSPLGMTLSSDGGTLYAALGDMNAVGVVSLATGKVTGYIPAGWYPTAVAAAPYRRLLVTNAKGIQTRYANPAYKQYDFGNNPSYDPTVGYDPNINAPKGNPYDLNLIEGTAQLMPVPNSAQLSQDTQLVLANNRLARHRGQPAARAGAGGHQARDLHRQGEPHLRPGAGRLAAGQRRPVAGAVRQGRDAEPARAGLPVRAAGQLLRLLRGERRRLAVEHAEHRHGVRHQEPALQLQRPGPQLRL